MFARFSTMFNPGGGSNNGNNISTQGSSPKKPCNRSNHYFDKNADSLLQSCQVDNSIAVIAKIANLYAERLMSDITLVINGVDFPAHRLILCASSDVFQVMLMNPNWSESQETRVVLQESPECAQSFESFLKYLYTGKLKLELTNVMHLLTLADKYNVKDLIKLCLEYMIHHIPAAASQSQLIHWFQHTSNCGHEKVADACKNFIKWNFEMISKAQDFNHLDLDLLTSILLEDDIVIYDEYALYTILVSWITCQQNKFSKDDPYIEEKKLQLVQEAISCIRFPMISSRQLGDVLISPLARKYKEPFMEKMAIGMAFHHGVVDKMMDLILSHPYKSKLFTPRLYCTNPWSDCLSVENFHMMHHYQSQALVFSTPLSFSEKATEKQVEWIVDFYPKGVCFQKCYLIVWQGTVEIPEHVLQTVRLSVFCKSDEESEVRVQIGVLIAGDQDGVEHIRSVVRKNYIFSERDKVLNIENLLPYSELTPCAVCNVNNSQSMSSSSPRGVNNHNLQPGSSHCCAASGMGRSCFLVGKSHESLKIRIVIIPMSEIANEYQ